MTITNNDIIKLKSVFATKKDLQRFATKQDLEKFATKDDLKMYATKDDLKMHATKDDLKMYATKDDLIDFKDEILKLLTKFRSDMYDKLDGILKEIVASRQEQTILSHKVSDHEDRITSLEAKVPSIA